ncbi:hypothetical protein EVAR_25751_1 [Eumeta japonica]|uniref:Uncharacterized protein n=1 Tax=Eumeta variegata TaxID=151549 RepID=A0A4C1V8Y5_EUMVA|nr:hypothetical protein EVAR_25751_1 [Eumeta japonica]
MHGKHFCLEYRVKGLELTHGVPELHPIPPLRQGHTDFSFNSAIVSANVRPKDGELVHRCRIDVLHALESEFGNVSRVRKFAEIHGALELPVGTDVLSHSLGIPYHNLMSY